MKSLQSLAMWFAGFIAVLATPVFGVTCSVSTIGVSLGTYIPNQTAATDSAGMVIIDCAKGALDALPTSVNYSVDISRGASLNYAPREMISGVNTLRYNLYRDASRISVWGDTTGGTSNVTAALQLQAPLGTVSGSHSVYGRIFAAQNAVPGAYSDVIIVTVNY